MPRCTTLFTRGLRGEAQKETEIGPVPESWELVSIGDVFEHFASRALISEVAIFGPTTARVIEYPDVLRHLSQCVLGAASKRHPRSYLARCVSKARCHPTTHTAPGRPPSVRRCEPTLLTRRCRGTEKMDECLFQNHCVHRPTSCGQQDERTLFHRYYVDGMARRPASRIATSTER